MTNESLGKQLKLMRKKKGLTQEGLGIRVHCAGSGISRIENGKATITLDQFLCILGALGIDQVNLERDPTCTSYADTSAWEVSFFAWGRDCRICITCKSH